MMTLVGILAMLQVCDALKFSWKDCSQGKAHVKIHDMSIEPKNPSIGDKIRVALMASLDKNTSKISCDVAMASKYHHKIDFCKGGIAYSPLHIATFEAPGKPCPLEPHTDPRPSYTYTTFNKHPPSFASPTTITKCTDQDGELFSCVETTFKMDADEQRRLAEDNEMRLEYFKELALDHAVLPMK